MLEINTIRLHHKTKGRGILSAYCRFRHIKCYITS